MDSHEVVLRLLELIKLANPAYRILYRIKYFDQDKIHRYNSKFLFESICDAEAVLKLRNYIYDVSEGKEDIFYDIYEDDGKDTIQALVDYFFDNSTLCLERVILKEIRAI